MHKAAFTHNEINKALQQSKKRACLFQCIGHTAQKCLNELQTAKLLCQNGSDRFSCNDHCNETCEDFECKVIATRHSYLISIIWMLLKHENLFS